MGSLPGHVKGMVSYVLCLFEWERIVDKACLLGLDLLS